MGNNGHSAYILKIMQFLDGHFRQPKVITVRITIDNFLELGQRVSLAPLFHENQPSENNDIVLQLRASDTRIFQR